MADNKEGAKMGEEQIAKIHDPILAKYTNRFFRSFDLDYPDVERANIFLKELARLRPQQQHAAPDGDAPRQRSHQRHDARQAFAAVLCGG